MGTKMMLKYSSCQRIKDGCVGGIMDSDQNEKLEWETCYIHLCSNTHGKGMNSSLPSPTI